MGIDAFIHKLKQIGYRGVLSIERDEPIHSGRDADIRKAVHLLKSLTGRA